MEIYVLGNSRSGTTMMGRILNNHTEVNTFNELHFFEEIYTSKNAEKQLDKKEQIRVLSTLLSRNRIGYLQEDQSNSFEEVANKFSDELGEKCTLLELYSAFLKQETLHNSKTHSCDQTPRNIFYLDTLLQDPNKKVILMIRDPRAVLLSQKKKWKRRYLGANQIPFKESIRSWSNYHPYTISKMWNTTAKLASYYNNSPHVFQVKYEDLIEHPESTIKGICDFLEIQFQNNMLSIPKVGSSNATDSSTEKGIIKNDNNAWEKELLTAEIAICQSVNKDVMSNLEYPKYSMNPLHKVLYPYYFFTFIFKTTISLLLNLKRIKNLSETIQRRFLPQHTKQRSDAA
jgi:hypothetical protein